MNCTALTRRAANQRGLTLVEIIVVLIILSILMAFLGGKLFKTADTAKADINKLKMQQVKSAVSQYQLRYNSLPPSLDALVNGTGQNGDSFMRVAEPDDLIDAWGTPFQYVLENGGRSFKIKSLGADRIEGGSGVDFDATLTGP